MGRGRSPGGRKTQPAQTTQASAASTAPQPQAQVQQQNQVTQPTPQQVAQGNVLPSGGVAFSDFEKMTDTEKAQVISDALDSGVPLFLDDSPVQRFAYFTGMNDKPNVVSDAQLDKISGKELFRTVTDVYNRNLDISYKADEICDQIMHGDFTMYSDSGGSAYGRGIYFADNYAESSYYGSSSPRCRTMRAKLTGKNYIQDTTLRRDYNQALAKGDPIAKAAQKATRISTASGSYGSNDDMMIYALSKGYDAVYSKSAGYYVILNRRALTCSSTVKQTVYGGSW